MNEQLIIRLNAIMNTLNGAMLRADQVDAVRRIDACTQEIRKIIEELSEAEQDAKETVRQPRTKHPPEVCKG